MARSLTRKTLSIFANLTGGTCLKVEYDSQFHPSLLMYPSTRRPTEANKLDLYTIFCYETSASTRYRWPILLATLSLMDDVVSPLIAFLSKGRLELVFENAVDLNGQSMPELAAYVRFDEEAPEAESVCANVHHLVYRVMAVPQKFPIRQRRRSRRHE